MHEYWTASWDDAITKAFALSRARLCRYRVLRVSRPGCTGWLVLPRR